MVHATQLQNVHQRVGQQTETVQQDLELAVLLRKFSVLLFIKLIFWGPKGIVVGTLGNSGGDLGELNWKSYIIFPGELGYNE